QLADAVRHFLDALGDAGPLIGELAGGVADVLTPAVRALADLIQLIADGFNALPEPAQDVVGAIGGIGIAALAFLVIGGRLLKFFGGLSTNIKDSIDWLKKFRKAQDDIDDTDVDVDPGTKKKTKKKG
ncbi:hypothetical protein, partial [Micrococcus sp. KRD096]|uniref:hypothetical protein n=1 Tax=Micrococcus sp. KRD096 TaxID=2729721 RepID=UPI0019D0F352